MPSSPSKRARLLAILASLSVMALMRPAPGYAAEAPAASVIARFTVTVRGKGPDVILIAGLASSAHVWDAEATRLEAHYRLHLVQVSGFAGTPAGPNATGPVLQPLVDGIAAYIESRGLKRPAVVGHSLGGLAGLLLAVQHPDQVGRLMMVDSLPWYGAAVAGPTATPAMLQPQAAALRDLVVGESQEAYAASEPMAMARLVKSDGAEAHAAFAAAVASDHRVVGQATYDDLMTDLRARLPEVRAPVTVLYPWDAAMGAPQNAVDAFYTGAFAGLPGAKVRRVDGAFHFLMIDQPDAFAREVDGFLAGAGA